MIKWYGILSNALSYVPDSIHVNIYNTYLTWCVAGRIYSFILGGVNVSTNGHRGMFDWVIIQLTKLSDQRNVVQLLKLISLALWV